MAKSKFLTKDGKRLYAPGKEPGYKRKVFIKLTRQARKTLKKQGTDISWNDAQKYVSKYLYQDYKDELLSNIETKEVERVVVRYSKPNAPIRDIAEKCGSVFKVPAADYFAIEWFDIGNYFTLLPSDVKMRVNGGPYGYTDIAKAETFDYHQSGIAEIVNKIREEENNQSGRFSWEGGTFLVPGMEDDGNNCSYFIDYVLHIDGAPVTLEEGIDRFETMEATEIEERGSRKRESEKARKKRLEEKKEAEEAAREKREKVKKAKTRKLPTAKPDEPAPLKQDLKGMLALLRQDYDDGIYDKEEYKAERKRLIDKFE